MEDKTKKPLSEMPDALWNKVIKNAAIAVALLLISIVLLCLYFKDVFMWLPPAALMLFFLYRAGRLIWLHKNGNVVSFEGTVTTVAAKDEAKLKKNRVPIYFIMQLEDRTYIQLPFLKNDAAIQEGVALEVYMAGDTAAAQNDNGIYEFRDYLGYVVQ